MNTAALRNAAPPAPMLQAAAVPARPTPPDRVPARSAPGAPFADLLRHERAEAAAPAPLPVAMDAAAGEDGANDANDDTVEGRPEKPLSPARIKARSAAPPKSPAAIEESLREGSAAAETRTQEERAGEAANERPARSAEPMPPRPLSIADEPAPRQRAGAAGFASAGDDEAAAGLETGAGKGLRAHRAGRHGGADARLVPREDGDRKSPAELAPTPARAAPVPIESARAIEATLGRTAFEPPMHAAPLPASPSAPASAGEALPPGATMPPTSALPTPVDSPGFASALGVHVSLLARGGVQEAELHLNPADMGPVSIRIQLDGTEAQVQFGADLAQTRQAIEAGLPELASALRDAGFTLAGGGVSAHAGQRGHDDAPPLPTGAESAGAADGEAPGAQIGRAIRRVAEGGLDLYA